MTADSHTSTAKLARLTDEQLARYRRDGHLTVPNILSHAEADEAIADAHA